MLNTLALNPSLEMYIVQNMIAIILYGPYNEHIVKVLNDGSVK